MKIKSLLFTFIIAILSFSVYSQDPLYSQFYFNSVFTNPSLIGSNHAGTKIVYNQRQQWQKIPGSLSTSTFSMDMNCPKNTNFGIMAFHDSEGENWFMRKDGLNVGFAYKLDINKCIIRGGIRYGFYQKSLNWDQFIFYDQLDPVLGLINNSKIPPPNNVEKTFYHDISFGFSGFKISRKSQLFRIVKFGYSWEHNVPFIFNPINETFYNSQYLITPVQTFQVNSLGRFNFSDEAISNINIKSTFASDKFCNLDLSYNFLYSQFVVGGGIRWNFYNIKNDYTKHRIENINHGVLVIGFTNKKATYMITYSADIPMSGISSSTIITSEVNLIIYTNKCICRIGSGYSGYDEGKNKCEDFYRRGKTVPIW